MSKCPEFFYGNCPIIKTENKELISEFQRGIINALYELDMGYPTKAHHILKIELEKWEKKLKV